MFHYQKIIFCTIKNHSVVSYTNRSERVWTVTQFSMGLQIKFKKKILINRKVFYDGVYNWRLLFPIKSDFE